jgi:hypothetical protein
VQFLMQVRASHVASILFGLHDSCLLRFQDTGVDTLSPFACKSWVRSSLRGTDY